MGSECTVDMLDKGMIHIPGMMEWDAVRFHHATQTGVQSKTVNCFWNFPFNIFGPWLTISN